MSKKISIQKLAIKYYGFNPSGGLCHIVLDDGNTEDGHIRYCLNACEDEKDVAGYVIMDHMLDMDEDHRDRFIEKLHEAKSK